MPEWSARCTIAVDGSEKGSELYWWLKAAVPSTSGGRAADSGVGREAGVAIVCGSGSRGLVDGGRAHAGDTGKKPLYAGGQAN